MGDTRDAQETHVVQQEIGSIHKRRIWSMSGDSQVVASAVPIAAFPSANSRGRTPSGRGPNSSNLFYGCGCIKSSSRHGCEIHNANVCMLPFVGLVDTLNFKSKGLERDR